MLKSVLSKLVSYRKVTYALLISLLIIAILVLAGLLGHGPLKNYFKNKGPVPQSIIKSVNFPVYYPVQAELPSGYVLDKSTISSGSESVIMAVDYPRNQKIVFSEQPEPSATIVSGFYSKYMPLNTTFQTPLGTATFGAISIQQLLISLPTNNGTWILVTAPGNANQAKLKQTVVALTQAY